MSLQVNALEELRIFFPINLISNGLTNNLSKRTGALENVKNIVEAFKHTCYQGENAHC